MEHGHGHQNWHDEVKFTHRLKDLDTDKQKHKTQLQQKPNITVLTSGNALSTMNKHTHLSVRMQQQNKCMQNISPLYLMIGQNTPTPRKKQQPLLPL